jgi:hypothetical protein
MLLLGCLLLLQLALLPQLKLRHALPQLPHIQRRVCERGLPGSMYGKA